MSDSNVIKLAQPGVFTDSLTEILRSGARALLTQAVEAEVAEFLAKHADLKTETGQQRVVRHGHLPEREISSTVDCETEPGLRQNIVMSSVTKSSCFSAKDHQITDPAGTI